MPILGFWLSLSLFFYSYGSITAPPRLPPAGVTRNSGHTPPPERSYAPRTSPIVGPILGFWLSLSLFFYSYGSITAPPRLPPTGVTLEFKGTHRP